MATPDGQNRTTLQQQAYAISRARILEQVAINGLSALVIAVGAGIISASIWAAQRVADVVIVPQQVLAAIGFFGLGALVMLLLAAGVLYVTLRVAIGRIPSPVLLLGMLGVMIGLSIDSGTFVEALRKGASGVNVGEEVLKARQRRTTSAADTTDRASEANEK